MNATAAITETLTAAEAIAVASALPAVAAFHAALDAIVLPLCAAQDKAQAALDAEEAKAHAELDAASARHDSWQTGRRPASARAVAAAQAALSALQCRHPKPAQVDAVTWAGLRALARKAVDAAQAAGLDARDVAYSWVVDAPEGIVACWVYCPQATLVCSWEGGDDL